MRTRVILMMMFIALLALPMVAQAQEGEVEPAVQVVQESTDAVNQGDADAAQVRMSEDATVTVPAATVTDAAAPAPAEGEGDGDDDDGGKRGESSGQRLH